MQRTFLGLVALTFCLGGGWAWADVPQQVHYQGYLTNGAGEAIDCPEPFSCGETYEFKFRLYDVETGGVVQWEEVHTSLPVYGGSFNAVLGTVDPISANVLAGSIWLGVTVNTQPEMVPRQRLVSAAFAIRAETAETSIEAINATQLGGVDAAEFVPGPKFSGQFADLEGLPEGLSDGDDDTQLSEAEVDEMVANNGLATQAELQSLSDGMAAVAHSGDWNDLQNVPEAISDGDNDTLAGLSCAADEVARWSGSSWICSPASQGVPVLSDPPPCGPDNAGLLYFDTDTNRLMLCDGTEFQSLRVCSDTCPEAATFSCGLAVTNDCGSECGSTGTGPNPAQCESTSALCGEPVFDACDNVCGVAGTALNSVQCANVADASCSTVILDNCSNLCGTIGIGLNPDQCSDGSSLNCGEANTDNCDNTCAQPTGTFCPAPQFCSAGECACDGGLTACGNTCVNLSTDTANCGSCGNACAADEGCISGTCSSSISYGPEHTFQGMTSQHFITQGGCNPGGGPAGAAQYFCQSFYGPHCHAESGAVAHSTPHSSYPKMHKVSGCTTNGSDIPGTNCSGVPCKIGNWSENTSGVGNIVCTCTP